MIRVNVWKLNLKESLMREDADEVAAEHFLNIHINRFHISTIVCSPRQLKELAVGHLLTEGILYDVDEIKEVRFTDEVNCQVRVGPTINLERRISVSTPIRRIVSTECEDMDYDALTKLVDKLDLPKVESEVSIESNLISKATRHLADLGEIYRRTGGTHIAALFTIDGELESSAEDVGRHTAIDKVIGSAALKGFDFKRSFVVSSGRLSGDIVLKCARVGIPVIASKSAPLSLGLELAERTGITLLGFIRGVRMNIYTFPSRIIWKGSSLGR